MADKTPETTGQQVIDNLREPSVLLHDVVKAFSPKGQPEAGLTRDGTPVDRTVDSRDGDEQAPLLSNEYALNLVDGERRQARR
ncbi:hypothetical protein [Phytopseudomonas daroniae]|uniref:hypothetical protein n=1 Tax=Phytopseudomonas daroniae TaxID=2487519 RepID=UPI0010384CE0|nr:hypothetical protein [Pseudomonas daroniae]TBU71270.1 hypothetical protein DNK10_24955 [Pseudomonas daroniae]